MKGALGKLVPAIMAWLAVVITLALAPTIETFNTHVTTNVSGATNTAYMIGMTAITPFAGFLIIMGLLVSGGLFGVAAMRAKSTTVEDLLETVGAVVLTVIALAMFSGSVIGYIDALITAGTGFAKTAYGMLTIIIYVGIIGSASGYTAVKAYKKAKGSGRGRRSKTTFA